jgi:rubredoxin
MVCRDCGYVYRGTDFNDLPKDYKCPPCGSGKNAFRPEKKMDYKKDGFNAPGIRAAKRENKKAFEAKRAAARTAAEGGGKKKGLFGR